MNAFNVKYNTFQNYLVFIKIKLIVVNATNVLQRMSFIETFIET